MKPSSIMLRDDDSQLQTKIDKPKLVSDEFTNYKHAQLLLGH